MSDYILDPKKHQIRKISAKKTDPVLTVLREGTLVSRGRKDINRYLWPFCRVIDETCGYFFRSRMVRKLQLVPNRIVFATFQGTYTCNCKYITEELLSRNPHYEIIFLVSPEVYENREAYDFPEQVYLVKKNTEEAFFALGTASVWIDNALVCIWKLLPKKEGQLYINTWHGSLGIKRLGGGKYWKFVARTGNKMIDYFLTDSTFDEDVFRNSFWPDVPHLKIGHPRNDLFFHPEALARSRTKVYAQYHIPANVHLALYAPTFRENKKDVSAIHMDAALLRQSLSARFGGEWMLLLRLHFHNAEDQASVLSDGVIDAGQYPDMQELLAAADAGITDYSSWIFDYLFIGKPAFIYATDIEQYIHDRGFYYSLTETPFSIASCDRQLSENIMSFDMEAYHKRVQDFLKEKGCYEKGNACVKIARFLEENRQK